MAVRELRQSTAANVRVGRFLNYVDGITIETALDVTDFDIVSIIKGVSYATLSLTASGGDNDCVHLGGGFDNLELTTGNTDTLGELCIGFYDVDKFISFEEQFVVLPANVWDSKYSTDKLQVHVVEFTADVIDAASIKDAAIDAATFASGAINEAAIANDAINAATFKADALAAIQSECNDALVALNLDHLLKVADSDDVVDNSVIAKIATKAYGTADWSDFDNTTDSLQSIRDQGDQAWKTGSGAGATASHTEDTNWVRTTGDNDGGAASDTTTVNGTYHSTGEVNSGTDLEVDVTIDITDGEFALSLDVWGFYNGGGSHCIRVQAYNYTDSTYEDLGVMGLGSTVERHEYNFTPDHTDATNDEVKIKFLHAGSSGVTSHVLSIDKLQVNTISPVTNDGSGFTSIPWNASWDTEVESECNDALVANGLDHMVLEAVTGTDITDNSIIANIVSKEGTADWDDYVNTTGSLQALNEKVDTMDSLVDTLVASQVLISTTIASAGRSTTTARLTAGGSSDDDDYIGMTVVLDSDAGNGYYVSRTITDYDTGTKGITWSPAIKEAAENGGVIYIVPASTAMPIDLRSTLVDEMWDEVLTTGHSVANSAAVHVKDTLADTAAIEPITTTIAADGSGLSAIPTTDANLVEIGGLSVAGNLATLTLKQLHISNADGSGLYVAATAGNNHGVEVKGYGNKHGVSSTGGASGSGLSFIAGASGGDGIYSYAPQGNGCFLGGGTTGAGLNVYGGTSGPGLQATGRAGAPGFRVTGGPTGSGADITGGADGKGVHIQGGSNSGSGMVVAPQGGTYDIEADIQGTINGMTTAMKGEVQDEVQDAIEVNHLDHLLAVAYNSVSPEGVSTSFLNELTENDGGLTRFTANALERAPTGAGIVDGDSEVVLTVEEVDTTPIPDVKTTILNSDSTVVLATAWTDSSGDVSFSLDDGTYNVLLRRMGFTFTVPETLVVDGTPETATYNGTEDSLENIDPDTCLLYEYCVDHDGDPLASVTSFATVIDKPYDDGTAMFEDRKVSGTYTVLSGHIAWTIVRGCKVKIDIEEVGLSATYLVPDQATARIGDLTPE